MGLHIKYVTVASISDVPVGEVAICDDCGENLRDAFCIEAEGNAHSLYLHYTCALDIGSDWSYEVEHAISSGVAQKLSHKGRK